MPYCIYLRKSRADEEAELRGEEDTLARYERALLDLARRQKLNITAIYPRGSGETISARPVMQQLLSEIEQCFWEGVLVMEVERLARGDTIDQGIVTQAFRYSNTSSNTSFLVRYLKASTLIHLPSFKKLNTLKKTYGRQCKKSLKKVSYCLLL